MKIESVDVYDMIDDKNKQISKLTIRVKESVKITAL